jgi:hypothetical protein
MTRRKKPKVDTKPKQLWEMSQREQDKQLKKERAALDKKLMARYEENKKKEKEEKEAEEARKRLLLAEQNSRENIVNSQPSPDAAYDGYDAGDNGFDIHHDNFLADGDSPEIEQTLPDVEAELYYGEEGIYIY